MKSKVVNSRAGTRCSSRGGMPANCGPDAIRGAVWRDGAMRVRTRAVPWEKLAVNQASVPAPAFPINCTNIRFHFQSRRCFSPSDPPGCAASTRRDADFSTGSVEFYPYRRLETRLETPAFLSLYIYNIFRRIHILWPVEYKKVSCIGTERSKLTSTPTSLFYQSFTRVLALWNAMLANRPGFERSPGINSIHHHSIYSCSYGCFVERSPPFRVKFHFFLNFTH